MAYHHLNNMEMEEKNKNRESNEYQERIKNVSRMQIVHMIFI